MTIRLYNTLTRSKETFVPIEEGKVRMYMCGPTVYNHFHIGNARAFVVFDVVRRYLEYRGFEVIYVQNFTDVDDRIIRIANEEGVTAQEVADRYVASYFETAEALAIHPADVHPRVTEHMAEIIEMNQTLIEKGYAYESQGDVYYRTSHFDGYGKLSHQSTDDLQAGARIEISEKKENPLDFALWKAAKEGEVSWSSPWGMGRPGWHIECSAMSKKYLGETVDIHAGGQDLIFPHHENEIAQSEAANGKTFARYWMHNGYINFENEKMSKSLGNIVWVHDLVRTYDSQVVRFFLLSAHYRNPVNFSEELLQQSAQALGRIYTSMNNMRHWLDNSSSDVGVSPAEQDLERIKAPFITAMDDDFNTADAISTIFDRVREVNALLHEGQTSVSQIKAYWMGLSELLNVLGLSEKKEEISLTEEVERLIEERTQARKDKNFGRSDQIRDQLVGMGIALEDTPQGVRWKRM